jgi:hypothetical protein
MIVSLVSLVLKNVFLMHLLLVTIDLFRMMSVLSVLVLPIALVDQLNLFALPFKKTVWVARMIALCDLGHPMIGMCDQPHLHKIVFFLVGLAMPPFPALPRWFVMILVCSGPLHRRHPLVTIVQFERCHEIET